MKTRIIDEKSKAFGVRILNMVTVLKQRCVSRSMLDQVERCGTSIGANIHEGYYTQSTNDYISKHSIALKEANETKYWLAIFHDSNKISDIEFSSMDSDLTEIIKILTKLIKTSKGL